MVAGAPADLSAGAFAAYTKCVPSRTRSVFHRGHGVPFVAPGVYSVLWYSGRGRSCTPFRGFSFLIFRSERVLRSEHPLDARARKACFVAPGVYSVLWYSGRERMCLPFSGFSFLIFRSERVLRSAHEVCSTAHTQCVLSHRWFCPFCKNRGRGRSRLPFRGFSFLIFRSERVLRSEHPLDARARKACSIAHAERVSPRQWFCPFCKNRGRGRSCLPFRG